MTTRTLIPMALIVLFTPELGASPPPDTEREPLVAQAERQLPSVDDVMDHLDDLYRSESAHSEITMEISTENFERTLELESWSIGEDDSLVVIRSPAREAGTATLMNDEGLWNYAPRADRLMRIPSGMMSDGWMGSHVTNDDLMRETSYDEDYDTELMFVEDEGQDRLLARSTPTERAAVVYSRVDFYMQSDDWMPLRVEYFDGDELIRTFFYEDPEDVDGRTIPMTMRVVPEDAPDEYTRIHYDELELDVDVDESLFTQRGLRREAQRR